MVRKLLIISVVLGALVATSAAALAAPKPGAHWITEPVCTLNGTSSVSCTSGSVAGLGNQPVIFEATVDAGCSTKPDSNNPPGHAQFGSEPISPRGGRIDTPSFTLGADCPPGLNSFVGSEVTFTIYRLDGTIVFQDVITAS